MARSSRPRTGPSAGTDRARAAGRSGRDGAQPVWVDLECTAVAAGGDAIARLGDGTVVFVRGALPGERVRARLTERRRDFARAEVVEVQSASSDRVTPFCARVADGCGGCGWQHVAPGAQPGLKRSIVVDALRRLGRITGADALVRAAPPLPAGGARTTVRAAVTADGRAGFRAAGSHRVVPSGACPVVDPRLGVLLAGGRFTGAEEVTLRTALASDEVIVVAAPHRRGVRLPDALPGAEGAVTVAGEDELAAGAGPVALYEEVAGHRFRVSAGSFFQSRPDGAAALVAAVADALDGAVGPAAARLVDLYGGVGLFAVTVGSPYAEVVCVEANPVAAEDARVNLAGRGPAATVVVADVHGWRPPPATAGRSTVGRSTVVVADPARAGLGRAGVATVAACDPVRVVLVSCDAASLGRDAALLEAAGFVLRDALVVDLFPHTPHVEVVSRFDRAAASA